MPALFLPAPGFLSSQTPREPLHTRASFSPLGLGFCLSFRLECLSQNRKSLTILHNWVQCHPALLPLSLCLLPFQNVLPLVLKCFPVWLSVLGTMCSLTPDPALEAEELSLLPSRDHPTPLLQGRVRLPGHCPPEQFPVKSHD